MAQDRSGYGGKWVKWAAIYLVAGAIVYAIVYFVFLHHSGGGGGGRGGGYLVLPLLLEAGRRLPDGRVGRRTDGPKRPAG